MKELLGNRWAVFGVTAAVLIVVTFATIYKMRQPRLFPGDRLETRTCRECGGSGKEMGDTAEGEVGPGLPRAGDPCIGCGGPGKVEVIVPGPNHPVMVSGRIYEGKARQFNGDPAINAEMDVIRDFQESRDPRQPIQGAIAGAQLRFEKDGQVLEMTSPSTGRFRAELPPGRWKLKATASGYADVTQELEVPALTEPLWQEKAHIIRETDNQPVPVDVPMQKQ